MRQICADLEWCLHAPILWQIWFATAITSNDLAAANDLSQLRAMFTSKQGVELSLSISEHRRLGFFHQLCIENAKADWQAIGLAHDDFMNLLELSLSLNTAQKLTVSASLLLGLTQSQIIDLVAVFIYERAKF